MSKPIALLFGVGTNIGAATVGKFLANGYRVAQASRSANPGDSAGDTLVLKADLSDHTTIPTIFDNIRKTWGEPSVVIYNAAALHFGDAKDTIGSTPLATFQEHLEINTISAFVAAQESIKSFKALPESTNKAFLYTGNLLNEQKAMPGLLTLGLGKSASAYLISEANESYKEKGFRFHYVDQRTEQGGPVGRVPDAQGHADIFLQLAEGKLQVPWQVTWVSGIGYKKFPKAE